MFQLTIDVLLKLGLIFWDAFRIKPEICVISESVKKLTVTISHDRSVAQATQLQEVVEKMPFFLNIR